MKKFIQVLVLCLGLFSISSACAKEIVKFIEVENHLILKTDPGQLQIEFTLKCNQEFLRVIRQEIVGQNSFAFINVGVLAIEDTQRLCTGAQDHTVSAGYIYSGRDYEVLYIKK